MYKTHGLSRRGFVRLISFLMAGLIAFGIMSFLYHWRNTQAKRHIEYSYLRSLEHLSLNIDNIKTSLNKGLYSNSPQMMNELSGKMSSEALSAKMSLSQLPIYKMNLNNTNKFLSQIGSFSQSLARRFANGEELTSDDRKNLESLLEHAENLSGEIWGIENMVAGGHLTFDEVVENAEAADGGKPYPAHVSGGFENVEGLFDEYPELIYDGPFSDHIAKQNPRMLKGQKTVSVEEGLKTAKSVSDSEYLEFSSEGGGKIPSYTYKDGDTTVSVTKDGGMFVYMLKYRRVDDKKITTEQAIKIADDYLTKIGYNDMTDTYYELSNGVCTINFAGLKDNVTVYTDLIKVGVALDDGEIMSFDSRGYITAHHDRVHETPKLTQEQAAKSLSPHLKTQHVKLAIVPSDGENERFCYEFLCTAENGNQILVYINADTGYEEQIMLMKIGDNGTLVV